MNFTKFILKNHPDPDSLLNPKFDQMCILAEKYAESLQSLQSCVISWVSIKDNLPQNRQRVLFSLENGDVHKAVYLDKLINQYGDYEKVFLSENGGHYQLQMNLVTFWCEVPTPPSL